MEEPASVDNFSVNPQSCLFLCLQMWVSNQLNLWSIPLDRGHLTQLACWTASHNESRLYASSSSTLHEYWVTLLPFQSTASFSYQFGDMKGYPSAILSVLPSFATVHMHSYLNALAIQHQRSCNPIIIFENLPKLLRIFKNILMAECLHPVPSSSVTGP